MMWTLWPFGVGQEWMSIIVGAPLGDSGES
jgi:hypothetical protein